MLLLEVPILLLTFLFGLLVGFLGHERIRLGVWRWKTRPFVHRTMPVRTLSAKRRGLWERILERQTSEPPLAGPPSPLGSQRPSSDAE